MSLEPEAWAEIARLWIEGDEPLGQIGSRFGISHQRIVGRARREGWPLRGGGAAGGSLRPAGAIGTREGTEQVNPAGAEAERPQPGPRPVRDLAASLGGGSAVAGDPVRKRNRNAARRAIVERLFDAMDVKLSALEERIAAGGDSSPVDSERTTRALNTLVRSLEKLADYEGKIGKGKGRRNDKPRTAAADAERRRSELARRIQRLLDNR